MLKSIAACLLLLIAPASGMADDLAKSNAAPEESAAMQFKQVVPGAVVVMPDGRRTIIENVLENGQFRTSLGQIVSEEGVILSGLGQGTRIAVDQSWLEEHSRSVNIRDHQSVNIDRGSTVRITPQAERPSWRAQRPSQPEGTAPGQNRAPSGVVVEPDKGQGVQRPEQPNMGPGSIAELLPMTTIAPARNRGEGLGEGQLSIPDSARTSGNLDFLQGCWEGTRPEGHTKRAIRECFCFNGKGSGQRVINDPKSGICKGNTQARLEKDGKLFFNSQRAKCSKKNTYSASTLICAQKGQRASCRWDFEDGENQSYEIPFARVNSCGG